MLKRHLDDGEVKALRAHLKGRTDAASILFELMFRTGCRKDELCRIEVRHIDVAKQRVTIRHGSKGSNARSPMVRGSLLGRLIRVCEAHGLGHGDLIVATVSDAESLGARKRTLERLWEQRRLEVFGFGFTLGLHCFRHTFAKRVHDRAVKAGNVDAMKVVQLGLGHVSIGSTQHYMTHLNYDSFQSFYDEDDAA